jgi:hypothetical protein
MPPKTNTRRNKKEQDGAQPDHTPERESDDSTHNTPTQNETTNETTNDTNWARDSETPSVINQTTTQTAHASQTNQSVMNFDRSVTRANESKPVSSLSNDELLQVLITRGEDQRNPVLSSGSERILKQTNRERIRPVRNEQSEHPPHHQQHQQHQHHSHVPRQPYNNNRFGRRNVDNIGSVAEPSSSPSSFNQPQPGLQPLTAPAPFQRPYREYGDGFRGGRRGGFRFSGSRQ